MIAVPMEYIKRDWFDGDIISKIDFAKMFKDYIKMEEEIDDYNQVNATDEETKHIHEVAKKVRMIEDFVEEVVKWGGFKMTFGLLFKYGFAAALGASCGVIVVMLVISIINAICGFND